VSRAGRRLPHPPRTELVQEEAIGILLLDHPPRNLLTRSMVRDLAGHVAGLEKDIAVRAVVVAGAGEAEFSGGLDLEEWAALSPKEAQEEIRAGQDALWALEHLSKPTVAAISGVCRGAGAEVALACDLRIASETATFAFPEVDLAWMPSHGGTARLARVLGRSAALELLVSGRTVKALDALRLGLVDHMTTPGDDLEQAKRLARAFAEKPRAAVRAIKRTLVEGEEKPYRNRFLLESQHAVQLLWSEEYREAARRTAKKRP